MHRWRIRSLLTWLVLACLLPGMVGVAFFFFRDYQTGRQQLEKDSVASARALVQVVDGRLHTAKVSAMALSSAGSLARHDFLLFHKRAKQLLDDTGVGTNVVLSDRSGQQLVNTLQDISAPLPKHGNSELLRQVFATGKPATSDLYVGEVLQKPVISVDVPIWVNGKITYDLSIGLMPKSFDGIINGRAFPSDWVIAILDSSGTIVARSHAPEKYVGQKATPDFLARVLSTPEGSMLSVTKDGIPALSSWSRSPVTGWSVAIAIPRASLEKELIQSLTLLAIGMVVLLIIGLGMALTMGSRISRSVKALQAPAISLGAGDVVSTPSVDISEVYEVATEMARASELLVARTTALNETNQRLLERDSDLREAHRLARFGDWQLKLASGEITVSDSVRKIFGREIPTFAELKGTLLPPHSWETIHTAIQNVVQTGVGFDLEVPATHANGTPMWINVKGEAIRGEGGEIFELLGTVMDITQRKEAEAKLEAVQKSYQQHLEQQVAERTASLTAANKELERQSRVDSLTGLYNRIAADERLRLEFLLLKRSGSPYAVLFMDIDHFKSINDTYGHEIGDHVLRQFASVVSHSVRESDFVARFGGEEFLAVLPDTSMEGALLIAEKIRSAVALHDFGAVAHITVSIGGASGVAKDLREEVVVRRADDALYQAKNSGRNAVKFCEAD